MTAFNRLLYTVAIAALMLLSTPNVFAKKLLSDVTLGWKPTDSINPAQIDVGKYRALKIRIGSFGDTRENKKLIAENREDESEGTILPVTTASDIPAWVSTHLADQLQQIGFNITAGDADFVLDGSVEKFFVLETDNYRATITLHLRLSDKTGKVVLDTTLTANESRFGRSYKLENYEQVLSDGVQNLARAIAKSPDLENALLAH